MKNIKQLLTIFMLLGTCIYVTGCWDQKIYERIGFMLQVGLELDNEGKLKYTTSIPLISQGTEGKSEILSTTISNMREGRDKIRHVAGKTVEGGKIQQIFFSEELATKNGISQFMEIFLRSPENPLLANVIVVEGSPNELMKFSEEFKDKPRPTFYVNGLLVSARRNSYVPETRISHFTILNHSGTIDPAAPLVRYNSKEIQVVGTALFSRDKMVGKITSKDAGLLLGLMGEKNDINYVYKGPYSIKSEDNIKSGAVIYMKNKERKIKIKIEDDKPIIDIKVDFKGSLSEYSGELNLSNQIEQEELEKAISASIQKDCLTLLKYLVGIGSDPIGFGEIVRSSHNKYWKSKNWKEAYGDSAFNVEAKVELEFYGAVDNP